MKRLFLSAIFAVVAFVSNAQLVTISGFGTTTKFGPINDTISASDILLDKYEIASEDMPSGYKYIVNFSNKSCTLFDELNQEVQTVNFKIVEKKSNRDFQIEFIISNPEDTDTYGLVVKDNSAAYVISNGRAVNLMVFSAVYIY